MTQKTKNILSWILAILLAVAFLGAGITKLAGVEMQLKNLESWGYPLWLRFPIGISEIGFAVGLLWPKFRRITAIGIFPWAVVAVITHIQADPAQYDQIGAPLFFAILAALLLLVTPKKS